MANPSAFSYVTTEDGKGSAGESPARRLTLVPGGGTAGESAGGSRGRGESAGGSRGAGRGEGRGESRRAGRGAGRGETSGAGIKGFGRRKRFGGRPTLTRRAGWFEMNPGCFGRAALVAAAATGMGGAVVVAAWRLRALFVAAKVARRLYRWVRG